MTQHGVEGVLEIKDNEHAQQKMRNFLLVTFMAYQPLLVI